MDLSEKVRLLEEKVAKLESEEKKRKRKKYIKIGLKIAYYLGIIIILYIGYRYLKVNYLDPYDNFKNSVNEKLDDIKNYDYKSLLDGLFSTN